MIIVEGIDGTGKTVLVSKLKELGFNTVFYDYDPITQDLISKYRNINLVSAKSGVSDRSFISELTYGTILRGYSRLTLANYKSLLSFYASIGTNIVYLKADLETLLERRKDNPYDFEVLYRYFTPLNKIYDKMMNMAQEYISVIEFNTAKMSQEEILQAMLKYNIIMRE